MVGHQWLPWMNNNNNNATQGAATSAKQEHEISFLCSRKKKSICPLVILPVVCSLLLVACATLCVLYMSGSNRKPAWPRLFEFQNMSDSVQVLTAANHQLQKDNQALKELSVGLQEQNRLLRGTSARLRSTNEALSLESEELTERLVNLTSVQARLSGEREDLERRRAQQEETRLNMSHSVRQLLSSNAGLQEETRRMAEASGLLQEQLLRVEEEKRELLESRDQFQREIRNLSARIGAFSPEEGQKLRETVTRLQEENRNLSKALEKEQQEAQRSLDLSCPVVDHRTKERVCKKCQSSWKQFETKCYYFSSRTMTWSSSRAWCRAQGGDLLLITTEQEQRFVFESSRSLEVPGSRLWIGATDAEEEGDWRWVDGSQVSSADVQFWLSRAGVGAEPDDWKLEDPQGEDCGLMDVSEDVLKSWMDGSCRIAYRWICEKNI